MHPDVFDSEIRAFPHRPFTAVCTRRDNHRFDAAGNAGQIWIAVSTLDLVRIGVHREHVVAAVPQSVEHCVRAVVFRAAGYAGDRDPFAGEELSGGCFDRLHSSPS